MLQPKSTNNSCPEGNQGHIGKNGYPGPPGPPGPIGNQGPIGHTGNKGPQGPTGFAKTWFIGGETCTSIIPSNINRDPIPGDLMLNLDQCEVCVYNQSNQWISTGQRLNSCLSCQQVIDCLLDRKEITNECRLILMLPNCPPLFFSEFYQITSLKILGQEQMIGNDKFRLPTQLVDIMADLNFDHQEVLGTHFFVSSVSTNIQKFNSLENSITFQSNNTNNIIKYDIKLQCQNQSCYGCSSILPSDPVLICTATGATGTGLLWAPMNCIQFSGSGGAVGPTGIEGVMGITGTTGFDENQMFDVFLNKVIAVDCQIPSDQENNQGSNDQESNDQNQGLNNPNQNKNDQIINPNQALILIKDRDLPAVYNSEDLDGLTGDVAWIAPDCVLKPQVDLNREICDLPHCDSELVSDYDFSNPLVLIQDNGLVTGTTGYFNCVLPTGTTGFDQPIPYVKLAPGEKLFDSIEYCSQVDYTLTATIDVNQIINQIMIDPLWKIDQLVIGKHSQPIITTQFSSVIQLSTIFNNLGWIDLGNDRWSRTINVPAPSHQSWITIINGNLITQKILFETTSIADCSELTGTHYILTRIDECNYCWMNPNCFNLFPQTQLDQSNCDLSNLNNLGDCSNIEPLFDLRLVISLNTINLMKQLGSNNSIFQIKCYQNYGHQEDVILNQDIPFPLTLKNLVQVLEQKLNWTSLTPLENIDNQTNSVELIKNNCPHLITTLKIGPKNGINDYLLPMKTVDRVECHNLPFNGRFLIKTPNNVTGATCLDIPGYTGSQATGGTGAFVGYCFVDIDCVVPKVPPPFNLEYELCQLEDCCTGPSDDQIGVTGCNCVSTGCDHLTLYQNCVGVNDCDIEKLISIFGNSVNLQITGYQLTSPNQMVCPLVTPEDIGINPTMSDFFDAMIALGWVSDDDPLIDRPVNFFLESCNNIQYIIVNVEGADPNESPYPYLIAANCIVENECPSTDDDNMTLIKKPDQEICWADICLIPGEMGGIGNTGLMGPQGPTADIGLTGFQGPLGVQGFVGDTNVTGSTGPQGFQGFDALGNIVGPQGDRGETGPLGLTGFTGIQGPMADTGAGIVQSASNIGGGTGQLFDTITASGSMVSLFNFRTLVDGENITIDTDPNSLGFSIQDSFDWSNTIFNGLTGAQVDSSSSLTMNSGATLITNVVEETTNTNGVNIDGILFQDGGIEISNVPVSGPSTRPTFFDHYSQGSFIFDWVVPQGGALFDVLQSNVTANWIRVGDHVNINIPPVDISANYPGGYTGDGNVIQASVVLPSQIALSGSENHVQPYIMCLDGQTGPFTGIANKKFAACTLASTAIILSSNLDNGAGINSGAIFQGTEPINVNYLIP